MYQASFATKTRAYGRVPGAVYRDVKIRIATDLVDLTNPGRAEVFVGPVAQSSGFRDQGVYMSKRGFFSRKRGPMEHKETSFVRDESSGAVREESTVVNDTVPAPVVEASSIKSTTPARRAAELIYLCFGIIDSVLVIRLALKLLGANPYAGFAKFIYGVTDVLIAPFRGLFPNWISGQTILEPSLVVAILIYSLVAVGLVRLVALSLSSRLMVSEHSRSERLKPGPE